MNQDEIDRLARKFAPPYDLLDQCCAVGDAAAYLNSEHLASFCSKIGIDSNSVQFKAMRLIGDRCNQLEGQEIDPGWAAFWLLAVGHEHELDQAAGLAKAFAADGWRAAIPVAIELKRERESEYERRSSR